jgi:uncharacterized protein
MVLEGQFLERATLIPVGEKVVLEGLWHRGDRRPPLLIVPPPPAEGSMDHVVAAELAWAVAQAGFPSLRFNFRGVGASQGAPTLGKALVIDAEAALRVLEENAGATAIACAAVGSAAQVALELQRRHPGIAALCLISPLGIASEVLAELPVPVLVVVAAKDTREPRVALAAAVTERGGVFEVIEDADAAFVRNLPQVGRAVARFLERLEGEGGQQ